MIRKYMKFVSYSLLIVFLAVLTYPTRLSAQGINIPLIITISINGSSPGGLFYNSTLSPSSFSASSDMNVLVASQSIPSDDYFINGAIYTNCGFNRGGGNSCNAQRTATAQVSPLRVIMSNGSSQIAVDLKGRIGERSLSSSPRVIRFRRNSPVFFEPWKADIQIVGDVDESTIDINDAEGDYTGTFQITAVIL
ncbi:MAG: hypothetical protein QNJ31_07260 [Candidatus Caenarcaniphilales bacterium]|nr:hypothetical protein [Candidatus Caenarcaniphilales bacterium]